MWRSQVVEVSLPTPKFDIEFVIAIINTWLPTEETRQL